MRSAVFKIEFGSVKKLSSLTFHLRSRAPLITRVSSASPRCFSPARAFGAAHHARFLYGFIALVLHHGQSELTSPRVLDIIIQSKSI